MGYTNAGKSTLFNALTDSHVYAQDQLFATLDPTMRRIRLDAVGDAILADTVGFISHLPHRLVEAFRATLEEAASADLLLHVVDAAAEERAHNMQQVQEVLVEIGAETIPTLCVYNKTDLMGDMPPRLDRDENGKPTVVWLSAQKQRGFDLLYQAITELLSEKMFRGVVRMGNHLGSLRARLHRANAVVEEHYLDDGCCEMTLCLPEADLNRILAAETVDKNELIWVTHAA